MWKLSSERLYLLGDTGSKLMGSELLTVSVAI